MPSFRYVADVARTPEFERDVVVRQAMDVFWRRGFQGASLSLLGAAMGLKPGSIYAAFGSKEELFREALAAYVKRVRDVATAAERAPEARRPHGCGSSRGNQTVSGPEIVASYDPVSAVQTGRDRQK